MSYVIGGKQRAWAVAGCGWMVDQSADTPFLMAAEGERPVLVLPPGMTSDATERAFGEAPTELRLQREGWWDLMCEIRRLAFPESEAA